MTCWLAQFSDRPCDGQLVRCHLIKQQVFLKELNVVEATAAICDPRSWVPGCGGPMGNAGHHGMLDHSRTLRIPYEALPPDLLELAAETGLTWWLEREYRRAMVRRRRPGCH